MGPIWWSLMAACTHNSHSYPPRQTKINIFGGDIFICSTYDLPTVRKISKQRIPDFSFSFLFVSFLQRVFVGKKYFLMDETLNMLHMGWAQFEMGGIGR
jgi:hypothetical protein